MSPECEYKFKIRLVSMLKKKGLSINLYIHHSKVFSSALFFYYNPFNSKTPLL